MTPLEQRARDLAYDHLKEWIDSGTISDSEVERLVDAFYAAMTEAASNARKELCDWVDYEVPAGRSISYALRKKFEVAE